MIKPDMVDYDYGKYVTDALTIKVLKNVQAMLSASGKDDSLLASETFLKKFFQAKIDGYFEADGMMFLKLPDKLQKLIEDETYELVNLAYVDSFLLGYLLGIKDMQDVASMTEISTKSVSDKIPF